MSINTKDWKKSKYPSIKIHKKDKQLYLFDYTNDIKKRFRKQYKNSDGSDVYKIFLEWKSKVGVETTEDAITVNDYFELSQKFGDRNSKTKLIYEQFLDRYIACIKDMKIQDVKSRHIDDINQKTKHLSRRSRKRVTEILTPLFKIAIDDGLIDRSPIRHRQIIKRKPLEEKRVVTDAINKYKSLHKSIHKVFKDEPRIRALFLFGFSGRRKTETLQLKWSDINLANGSYVVRGAISKVSADMTFVMTADLKEALMQCMSLSDVYIFKSKFSDRPINNIDWHVMKIREDSGIKEFTFHLMRNISVSALAASGADALDLSSMLGHLDSGTLKKYLSLQREVASKKTNDISSQLLFG